MHDVAAMWGRLPLFATLAIPVLAAPADQAPAGTPSRGAENHLQQGKTIEAKEQVELYFRYKQIYQKLKKIIHDMREGSDQGAADNEIGSKQ